MAENTNTDGNRIESPLNLENCTIDQGVELKSATNTKGRPSNADSLEKEGNKHHKKITECFSSPNARYSLKRPVKRTWSFYRGDQVESSGSPSKRYQPRSASTRNPDTDLEEVVILQPSPQVENSQKISEQNRTLPDTMENLNLSPELKAYMDANTNRIISTMMKKFSEFHQSIDKLHQELQIRDERLRLFQEENKDFQKETRERLDKLDSRPLQMQIPTEAEDRIKALEDSTAATTTAPLYADIYKKVNEVSKWANEQDRQRRRDNIVIRGLKLQSQNLKMEMNTFIQDTFGF